MNSEETLTVLGSLKLKDSHSEMDMLTYLMVGPYDTDKIWNSFDSKTLANCRLVSKTWHSHLEKTWKKVVHQKIKDLREDYVGQNVYFMDLSDEMSKALDYIESSASLEQLSELIKVLQGSWGMQGETPIHKAAELGNVQVLKLFLDLPEEYRIPINDPGDQDEGFEGTALHLACQDGHLEVVKLLLDHPNSQDIDLNSEDRHLWNPLMTASVFGEIEIVQLFLNHPRVKDIELGARGEQNAHAVQLACDGLHKANPQDIGYKSYYHKETALLLLEHPSCKNVDFNRDDEIGFLHWTIQNSYPEVTVALLNHSCIKVDDLLEFDWYGRPALHSAVEYGWKDVVTKILAFPGFTDDMKLAVDSSNRTVLHTALELGNLEIVQLLLEDPAIETIDWFMADDFGKTLLHCAILSTNRDAVMKFLLQHPLSEQMDWSIRTKSGWTLFHLLCKNGDTEIVLLALDHPSNRTMDFNSRNEDGLTALGIATRRSNGGEEILTKIVSLLTDVQ